MSTVTKEVTTSYETDLWLVEVTVNLDLWCEGPDNSVGYAGGVSPDGYAVTEVFVSFYTDDTYKDFHEWSSKSLAEAEAALSWLAAGHTAEFNKGLETLMEKDHDSAAADYEGEDGNDNEPDWDSKMDEMRDQAREWGGMDGDY